MTEYDGGLTQNTHDVLPLSHRMQEVCVAPLYRRLLRKVYILCCLAQCIRKDLQTLDFRDRNEVKKETTEPGWPERGKEPGNFADNWCLIHRGSGRNVSSD